MNKIPRSSFLIVVMLICAVVVGCSTPKAAVTFHNGSSDGEGYDFVIPRTVVKIAPQSGSPDTKGAADAAAASGAKPVGTNNLMFTTVPLTTTVDGKPLSRFWVSDSSSSGTFSLTPTGITAATYADNLILSSIGTQVTDNRTTAIDAGISILGLVASAAGLGLAAAAPQPCSMQPPAFAIDSFDKSTNGQFVPGSANCWGYNVQVLLTEHDLDPNVRDVANGGLPVEQKVTWFPYPACRSVLITVYPCDPNTTDYCKGDPKQSPTVQTVNVSSGLQYRRMRLPVKGKITLHSDFCGADITDDPSGIQSNWALLKQAISDYNSLKQSKGTSSSSKTGS